MAQRNVSKALTVIKFSLAEKVLLLLLVNVGLSRVIIYSCIQALFDYKYYSISGFTRLNFYKLLHKNIDFTHQKSLIYISK